MGIGAGELLARADVSGTVGEVRPELCWAALESTTLGRLAVASDAGVDIFPVNYVVDGTKLYFRTAPGSKLHALVGNSQVALEIDAADDAAAYSIVVKGTAERLEAPSEIDAADALPLTPWVPTLKLIWVRIRSTEVSGRVFRRGPEPIAYP